MNRERGVTVISQIRELTRANLQLTQETNERKRAQESLHGAYSEVKRVKDRLQAENCYLRQEIARGYNFGEILGQSGAMKQVLLRVEQVATLDAAVLLTGEAGTGKKVAAYAIHNKSARRDRPMITVNLAALPANLVEGELFGWQRGECTRADAWQIGRLELADAGTVYLEEIAELPLEMQGRLVRLIKDGELERLGSSRTMKLDVRVIAGTSRELGDEVRRGRFREDLFLLLKVWPIAIPPLRERIEDLPELVEHFMARYRKTTGPTAAIMSGDAMKALRAHHWPGNVRELETVVERAVATSLGDELQLPPCLDASHVASARGGVLTE